MALGAWGGLQGSLVAHSGGGGLALDSIPFLRRKADSFAGPWVEAGLVFESFMGRD